MFLTRSPLRKELLLLSVRLACIRHAAGVYPEPGSNSQKSFFKCNNLNFLFVLSKSSMELDTSILACRLSKNIGLRFPVITTLLDGHRFYLLVLTIYLGIAVSRLVFKER